MPSEAVICAIFPQFFELLQKWCRFFVPLEVILHTPAVDGESLAWPKPRAGDLTESGNSAYCVDVFVAVVGEFASNDNRNAVADLLTQYGFKAILKDCYESTAVSETTLTRLKKDIDRTTDSYDIIRFYQYPVGGGLVLTSLKDKRWRRIKLKG
jgi:CRISPR-associated protein Cas2